MTPRLLSLLPLFALAGLHVACQPNIGDDCRTSIDCSPAGDRLCDVTQPGGYCTQFNCEPGTCPDDANCVAFDEQLSVQKGCQDANGFTRYTRSYCMEICENDEDCRAEYVCADLKQPNRWNALAVDASRSGKVCVVAPTTKDIITNPPDPPRETGVCTGDTGDGGAANGG